MTAPDPLALRAAFGSFMTGVAVVTTCDTNGKPAGFTANSFSSVSLDPPLLLVCPGKFLSSFDIFAQCTRFAVNILSEGQETVSNTFASFKGDRFAQVPHRPDAWGTPLIDGALAQFSCVTERAVPAGDHCILIGKVQDFTHAEGRGLGYAGGQYFSLGLERAALEQATRRAICGAIIEQGDCVLLEKTPDGYRPPQIARTDHGRMRQDLGAHLADRGIPVELGAAYSVFDEGQTHYAYFLAAAATAPVAGSIVAVPIRDLPTLRYATRPIAVMMARFATEAQTRSFSLYLGDAQRGDVHTLPERN